MRALLVSLGYCVLLASIQQAFGLGCLNNTCDTANVTPMTTLFATGD